MRVTHPDYGDLTEDVARELALLRHQRADEEYLAAERRQRLIARECGQESRVMKDGMRLVAHIDESVFNYWEAREGREFWKHEMDFMLKRHPELGVKPVNPNPVFGYRGPVRGKRGRWAA